MNEDRGKLLLKSKSAKPKFIYGGFLVFAIGFGTLSAILIVILFLKPLKEHPVGALIEFFITLGFCLFLSLSCSWVIFSLQLPYLIVYENGILLRRPPTSILLKKRVFFPFKKISDVEIVKKNFSEHLRLSLKNQDPHILKKAFILNLNEVYRLIKKQI